MQWNDIIRCESNVLFLFDCTVRQEMASDDGSNAHDKRHQQSGFDSHSFEVDSVIL